MEKKSHWIITKVDIGRYSFSIETYGLGYFDNLDEAKSFLENEYNRLCKEGCEPSGFTHNEWGWTYESEFIISKVVIILALGV